MTPTWRWMAWNKIFLDLVFLVGCSVCTSTRRTFYVHHKIQYWQITHPTQVNTHFSFAHYFSPPTPSSIVVDGFFLRSYIAISWNHWLNINVQPHFGVTHKRPMSGWSFRYFHKTVYLEMLLQNYLYFVEKDEAHVKVSSLGNSIITWLLISRAAQLVCPSAAMDCSNLLENNSTQKHSSISINQHVAVVPEQESSTEWFGLSAFFSVF